MTFDTAPVFTRFDAEMQALKNRATDAIKQRAVEEARTLWAMNEQVNTPDAMFPGTEYTR